MRASLFLFPAALVLLAAPVRADEVEMDNIRVWGSVFSGRSSIAGNASDGTQSVVASIVGTTFGLDTQLSDNSLIGASIGHSRQTFSSGTGNGRSDDVTVTVYARQALWDNAYIAEALGHGWHDVFTRRTVTVYRTDILTAQFRANDIGGRVEGGYNFTLPGRGVLSPFAAFVGDSYAEPSYGERAADGYSAYAVSYAANTIGISHMELGSRYYDAVPLAGMALNLDGTLAWEHDLNDNPIVIAAFQTAPGTNYVLRGTAPALDTALMGLGARLQAGDNLTFGLRGDTRLGARTTILSGALDFTYRW